eukprot:1157817-Pelagomonas_calceolata.AAC.6
MFLACSWPLVQENVYAASKKFTSFKKVATDLGLAYRFPIVSLHSTSKGLCMGGGLYRGVWTPWGLHGDDRLPRRRERPNLQAGIHQPVSKHFRPDRHVLDDEPSPRGGALLRAVHEGNLLGDMKAIHFTLWPKDDNLKLLLEG